jgi:hypothetical protein
MVFNVREKITIMLSLPWLFCRYVYMGENGAYLIPNDPQQLAECKILKGLFSYMEITQKWRDMENNLCTCRKKPDSFIDCQSLERIQGGKPCFVVWSRRKTNQGTLGVITPYTRPHKSLWQCSYEADVNWLKTLHMVNILKELHWTSIQSSHGVEKFGILNKFQRPWKDLEFCDFSDKVGGNGLEQYHSV